MSHRNLRSGYFFYPITFYPITFYLLLYDLYHRIQCHKFSVTIMKCVNYNICLTIKHDFSFCHDDFSFLLVGCPGMCICLDTIILISSRLVFSNQALSLSLSGQAICFTGSELHWLMKQFLCCIFKNIQGWRNSARSFQNIQVVN